MMTTSNILLALASFGMASIKTIGSERTTPLRPSISFIWSVLRKYTYGLLGAIVSMSEDGRNWFQKNTYAKKVLAMPNPVTWPLPLLEPLLYPPRFQPRILLGVGRLIEEKGFELLFEVFIELKDKYPEWGLAIVGDGPLRSFLEQRIKQSGLQNRVFLPGRVGNIGKWYESADIFALSSLYEGFPNVLVEAMAYGLPVVSFDCNSGPRDIIRHEIDGLLVRQGSKSDLTKALDRLMSDDLLRKKYSERALEVRERFSMENISEMWDRLFDELLNKN
jgi:glycosyltransferase involved in cell wall biosynthesis